MGTALTRHPPSPGLARRACYAPYWNPITATLPLQCTLGPLAQALTKATSANPDPPPTLTPVLSIEQNRRRPPPPPRSASRNGLQQNTHAERLNAPPPADPHNCRQCGAATIPNRSYYQQRWELTTAHKETKRIYGLQDTSAHAANPTIFTAALAHPPSPRQGSARDREGQRTRPPTSQLQNSLPPNSISSGCSHTNTGQEPGQCQTPVLSTAPPHRTICSRLGYAQNPSRPAQQGRASSGLPPDPG